MEKKTKYIIGGVVVGILALIVIYVNFFAGSGTVDQKATADNIAAAAESAAATAKNPPPPEPPPHIPPPGARGAAPESLI